MSQKKRIQTLLKGIETGDPKSVEVVNEAQYIQHNPLTKKGASGLADLFKKLSQTSPKVTMVRAFEQDEFVFAHMEYNFSSIKVAFEVFRFEDGFAVEHWDNIQEVQAPNLSGHTMLDGETKVVDRDKTEQNRRHIQNFVQTVLIDRQYHHLNDYINADCFIQHSPNRADGLGAFREMLEETFNNAPNIQYQTVHRILAEGNFVLTMSEGLLAGKHVSFYDLYRLETHKIVEHWDTIETIPDRSEWQNENGKF